MQEDTLTSYPLTIEKATVDMSSMIQTLSGNKKAKELIDNAFKRRFDFSYDHSAPLRKQNS